jgi:hypothetical protein
MRVLGDEYVKGEFRAHREVENPMHIVGLLSFMGWGLGGVGRGLGVWGMRRIGRETADEGMGEGVDGRREC